MGQPDEYNDLPDVMPASQVGKTSCNASGGVYSLLIRLGSNVVIVDLLITSLFAKLIAAYNLI